MLKKAKEKIEKNHAFMIIIFVGSLLLNIFIEMFTPNNLAQNIINTLIIVGANIFIVSLYVLKLNTEVTEYKEQLNEAEKEFKKSEKKVEKLENELKDESRVIWQKYHELNKYRIEELLKEKIKKFVSSESSIFSAQVYEYTELVKKDNVKIKVKFLTGYVEEEENLNSILQNYYILPKEEYLQYKELNENADYDNIHNYLNKIILKLKELESKKCNINYAKSYLFGSLILEKIRLSNGVSLVENETIKKKIVKTLNDGIKKVGLLSGILLNEVYWFSDGIRGEKEGRRYITLPFTFNEKPAIILFTGHKDILIDQEYLQNLMDRFDKLFKEKG